MSRKPAARSTGASRARGTTMPSPTAAATFGLAATADHAFSGQGVSRCWKPRCWPTRVMRRGGSAGSYPVGEGRPSERTNPAASSGAESTRAARDPADAERRHAAGEDRRHHVPAPGEAEAGVRPEPVEVAERPVGGEDAPEERGDPHGTPVERGG